MHPRPVIFGEILYDVFPGGESVLGGAPFNVAWHLQGFGLNPILIARVGDDVPGEQAIERLEAWGMSLAGVQIDSYHPTGRVDITMVDGEPHYAIAERVAWDYLDGAAALLAASPGGPLLYHGTLATRSPLSAAALRALRETGRPTFLDVNVRPPWFDAAAAAPLVAAATWLKLNDAETLYFSKITCEKTAWTILTHGAAGATLTVAGQPIRVTPPAVAVVDTVGAGDALAAVAIVGALAGWEPRITIERAVAFAADICTRRGATHVDEALYARHRDIWNFTL